MHSYRPKRFPIRSGEGFFLRLQDRIGSIAPGKDADLVVVNGDPSTAITDIEKVEIVFKDGIGYNASKLIESVKGRYGQY